MRKRIEIQIDRASWNPLSVPSEIENLADQGFREVDAGIALLHTALWTQPPECFRFSLATFWAWLRYFPALADTTQLRLRQEWQNIDPHQKTILSDELGVGLTTQLFAETLDFMYYADTQYVVKVVSPSLFSLGRTSKRGPRKSPDYMALDASLDFNVLECKGSQTSQKDLIDAVNSGIVQKENLTKLSKSDFRHSLVAGLFIPQWGNSESPLIHISDPPQEELFAELAKIPKERLLIGATQIALAKHFALMGFYSLSNALSTTHLISNEPLLPIDRADVYLFLSKNNDYELAFEITLPLHPNVHASPEKELRPMRFRISCPRDLYSRIVESADASHEILTIAYGLRGAKWKYRETEASSVLYSPLGFTLTLEF